MNAPRFAAAGSGRRRRAMAIRSPCSARTGRADCAARLPAGARLAVAAIARDGGAALAELARIDAAGFWCRRRRRLAVPYRAAHRLPAAPMQEIEDPYAFGAGARRSRRPSARRRHAITSSARTLGAHLIAIDGVRGVRFAVWAPNARRVSVVGDFNAWDGRRHPMRLRHGAGVWELFIPGLGAGALYKYELLGPRRRAAAAEGRSVRVRAPSCRPPPPRSSPTPAPRLARRGMDARRARAKRPARRSRSTRCISAPGCAGPSEAPIARLARAGRAPRALRRSAWASPISS